MMNEAQVRNSTKALGRPTVEMLFQVHKDALWVLENMGVGCKHPQIQQAYRQYETTGEAVFYENRIYPAATLVERCLQRIPTIDAFHIPRNSFLIGGTAPYIYDDKNECAGIMPTQDHLQRIAQIAENSDVVAGMGRGIKLNDELLQIEIMAKNCNKPIYFPVTSPETLSAAKNLYRQRGNIMILFCLTRPPLQINENFAGWFVETVRAGIPVCISSMAMAGVSAPYCYSGVLTTTHAEVLFGLCTAQLLNPGHPSVHAGFPTIADPRIKYNPNYGSISHNLVNLLMAHLNMMLDIPTFQNAGGTHEQHPTPKALADARMGQALCKKYGFHMIRHPFAFLRYLVDFSISKLLASIEICNEVTAEEAPPVEMPQYDPRGLESIQNYGLSSYMEDPLMTANVGKVFLK